MTPRVACYTRVSTGGQVEKWGLPTQRAALADHVKRQGWDVVEWFEDAGISGETLGARPAMTRMLADARAGRFDIVLAVEFERFSRSRHGRDWAEILGACEDGHVKIASLSQVLDPASPDDGMLAGLFGLLSAREKRKITERTRRGRRARAAEGKWAVGCAPYGYRVGADGHLVVVEAEADVVRSVFAAMRDGAALSHVARDLNERGVAPPGQSFTDARGRAWRPSSLRRMLANPTYTGCVVFGTRSHAHGDQPVVAEDAHEAIVPLHEFERTRALLAARNTRSYPRSHWDSGYILTGLIRCPTCDHGMQGKWSNDRKGQKVRYYICTAGRYTPDAPRCRAIQAEPVERAVLDELVRVLSVPAVLDEVRRQAVEEMLRDSTDDTRLRAELEGSIAESERRVRMLYDDRVAGLLSPAQFGEFNAAELVKQSGARKQIRAAEDRLLAMGRHADVEAIVGKLADLGRALDVLDPAERKLLLAETVSAVHATRGEDRAFTVAIDYRLPGLGRAPAQVAAPILRRAVG